MTGVLAMQNQAWMFLKTDEWFFTHIHSLSSLVSIKVSTWFFTTFSVSGMKEKVRYLDNLQQLFTCIKPEQLDIPPFVLEYDARVRTQ